MTLYALPPPIPQAAPTGCRPDPRRGGLCGTHSTVDRRALRDRALSNVMNGEPTMFPHLGGRRRWGRSWIV